MPGLDESDNSTMSVVSLDKSLSYPEVASNDRQCFDDQATYDLRWQINNRKDHNPTLLYQPYGVTFNGDDIFVAEGFWPYSRLQVFSATSGRSRRSLVQGQVLPFGIVIESGSGVVAMTDHKDRTVKFLSPDWNKLSSWPAELFDWPTGIDINRHGQYCVTDWYKGRVKIHDQDGQTILSFSSTSDDLKQNSCPMYVAVDALQRIVVSDTFDHSIKVFSDAGHLLLKLGDRAGPGKIVDPRGVCVDHTGNIIVADWGGGRVKMFSSDGLWIQDVLTKNDGLQHPWGVALRDDMLAITEQKLSGNPSLKLFSSTGNRWQEISANKAVAAN